MPHQTLETDTMSSIAASGELLEGPLAAVVCQAVGMCVANFRNFLAPDPDIYRSSRGEISDRVVDEGGGFTLIRYLGEKYPEAHTDCLKAESHPTASDCCSSPMTWSSGL